MQMLTIKFNNLLKYHNYFPKIRVRKLKTIEQTQWKTLKQTHQLEDQTKKIFNQRRHNVEPLQTATQNIKFNA